MVSGVRRSWEKAACICRRCSSVRQRIAAGGGERGAHLLHGGKRPVHLVAPFQRGDGEIEVVLGDAAGGFLDLAQGPLQLAAVEQHPGGEDGEDGDDRVGKQRDPPIKVIAGVFLLGHEFKQRGRIGHLLSHHFAIDDELRGDAVLLPIARLPAVVEVTLQFRADGGQEHDGRKRRQHGHGGVEKETPLERQTAQAAFARLHFTHL